MYEKIKLIKKYKKLFTKKISFHPKEREKNGKKVKKK